MSKRRNQRVAFVWKHRTRHGDPVCKRLPCGRYTGRYCWLAAVGTLASTMSAIPLNCVAWSGIRLFQSRLTAAGRNDPQDPQNGDSTICFKPREMGVIEKNNARLLQKCRVLLSKNQRGIKSRGSSSPKAESGAGNEDKLIKKYALSVAKGRYKKKTSPRNPQNPDNTVLNCNKNYFLPLLTKNSITSELETFTDHMTSISSMILALTRVAKTHCRRPALLRLSAAVEAYFQILNSPIWVRGSKLDNDGRTSPIGGSTATTTTTTTTTTTNEADVGKENHGNGSAYCATPIANENHACGTTGYSAAINEAAFAAVKRDLLQFLNQLPYNSGEECRIKGVRCGPGGIVVDALQNSSRITYENIIHEFAAKSATVLWYMLNQIESVPLLLIASEHWASIRSKFNKAQRKSYTHPMSWFMKNVQDNLREYQKTLVSPVVKEIVKHGTFGDMLEKYRIYWDIRALLKPGHQNSIAAASKGMSSSSSCSSSGSFSFSSSSVDNRDGWPLATTALPRTQGNLAGSPGNLAGTPDNLTETLNQLARIRESFMRTRENFNRTRNYLTPTPGKLAQTSDHVTPTSQHLTLTSDHLRRTPANSQSCMSDIHVGSLLGAGRSSTPLLSSLSDNGTALELANSDVVACSGKVNTKRKHQTSMTKSFFSHGSRKIIGKKKKLNTASPMTLSFPLPLEMAQPAKATDNGCASLSHVHPLLPAGSQEQMVFGSSFPYTSNFGSTTKEYFLPISPAVSASSIQSGGTSCKDDLLGVAGTLCARQRLPSEDRNLSAFSSSPVSQPLSNMSERFPALSSTSEAPRAPGFKENTSGSVNFFSTMSSSFPRYGSLKSLDVSRPAPPQTAGNQGNCEVLNGSKGALGSTAAVSTSWADRALALGPRTSTPVLNSVPAAKQKASFTPYGPSAYLKGSSEVSEAWAIAAPEATPITRPRFPSVTLNKDGKTPRAPYVNSQDRFLTKFDAWLDMVDNEAKKQRTKERPATPSFAAHLASQSPRGSVPEKTSSIEDELLALARPGSSISSGSATPSIMKLTPPPSATGSEWATVSETGRNESPLFNVRLLPHAHTGNTTLWTPSPESSVLTEGSVTAADISRVTENAAGPVSKKKTVIAGDATPVSPIACRRKKIPEPARRAFLAAGSLLSVMQAARNLHALHTFVAGATLAKALALAYRFLPPFNVNCEASAPMHDFSKYIRVDSNKAKSDMVTEYISAPTDKNYSLTKIVARKFETEVDNLERVFNDLFGDPATCTCNGHVTRKCWPLPRREYCSICRVYMKRKSRLYQVAATIGRLILQECSK